MLCRCAFLTPEHGYLHTRHYTNHGAVVFFTCLGIFGSYTYKTSLLMCICRTSIFKWETYYRCVPYNANHNDRLTTILVLILIPAYNLQCSHLLVGTSKIPIILHGTYWKNKYNCRFWEFSSDWFEVINGLTLLLIKTLLRYHRINYKGFCGSPMWIT
jgi:hypothetical protein